MEQEGNKKACLITSKYSAYNRLLLMLLKEKSVKDGSWKNKGTVSSGALEVKIQCMKYKFHGGPSKYQGTKLHSN